MGSHRRGLWCCSLKVHTRDALLLLWLLLIHIHLCRRGIVSRLLCMVALNVIHSLIQIKVKIMELLP